MKLSLKYTMGLVLLACSLLPVYVAGQLILNQQSQSSLEQKEIKLANSTIGIEQTVFDKVNLIASLTQWYSQDRSLIKAGGNIFFSSVVWDKMDSFNSLADSVSATYILDRYWKPIYDSKGSLYHFEKSQLLEDLKQPLLTYKQGKLFHTEFTEPELVDDASAGIAFVAPILPYRLIEGSSYTPQGYLVVLMGYDRLESKVTPFLYENESVEFNHVPHSGLERTNSENTASETKLVSIGNDLFSAPLRLSIKHNVSDSARLLEMQQSEAVFVKILFATLAIAIVCALLLSRLFSQQLNLLTESVGSYSSNKLPNHKLEEHRFTEFFTLSSLLGKMWARIQHQLSELTVRNEQLISANYQIAESNNKLENFNIQLEKTVEEKTSSLAYSLAREESHKHRILKIVQFASMRKSVEYRLIPELVNVQLVSILPNCCMQFSFSDKPESSKALLDSKALLGSKVLLDSKVLVDSKGATIGYFVSKEFDRLSEEDVLIFDLYQKQLAGWIELENITRVNMQTGCYNRKAFNEDFEFSKWCVVNNRDTLSLFIIDINGLKNTNDVYGHEVGDQLIQCSVEVIRKRLDSMSNLYRLGGDEFGILTLSGHGQDLQSAGSLVQCLYADQEGQVIEAKAGISIPVRFSIGFSCSESTDLDNLFAVADEDMYKQKRHYYQSLLSTDK